MSDNTHVLDLLPAYALGSLDADEAKYVSEHLLACLICRAELKVFQNVAEQLSRAIPRVAPPPDLKNRLMQRVQATRAKPNTRNQQAWQQWLQQFLPLWSFTSLLLIVSLTVFSLSLWQRLNRLEFLTSAGGMLAIPLHAAQPGSTATGFVIVSKDGENGALVVDGLPPLGADQQYQLWLIREGERTSGAIFSTDEESYGGMRIRVNGSLLEYSSVGVTIEPAGGSSQPTGAQVLAGQLFAP